MKVVRWLDALPSQSVLDGLESLPVGFSQNFELCYPVFDYTLPTFCPPQLVDEDNDELEYWRYVDTFLRENFPSD